MPTKVHNFTEKYVSKICSSLTSVVFKGDNPPKLTDNQVFLGTPSSLTFIVPKGAKSRYIKAGYPEDKLVEQ